jgi:SSS family transporter
MKAALGWVNTVVILVYLGGMLGVGWWFMKRKASSTTDAYFRGGQRVPWWVAGLSIFATMLSSLTFMGIPARSYATDMTWYIGQLPILLITPLVAFCYLPFFRKLNLTSAYEYLEKRFNAACRMFAAFSFLLLQVGRIAIVLYLPSLALASVSNIPMVVAIVGIGILCIIYTVIGGIEAVVWTDAIQALVLMGGAALCLWMAIFQMDGGLSALLSIVESDDKAWQNLHWRSLDWRTGTQSAPILFLEFFFNSFVSYTASQDVVQRYVTTRDIAAARRSLWANAVLSVFGSLVFFALGVAIYGFYKVHPENLDPTLTRADAILPSYVLGQLPNGLSGLVIAAIFAASQSTISSSLNSVSASWVRDVDARWLRPGREDGTYLNSAKWVVLIVGLLGIGIAVGMALAGIESAFQTFNTLIGLTAGSLGGLFALGIFSRSANGPGALTGALSGFVLVLGLYLTQSAVSGLLYACIGCVTAFGVGWLTSRLFPKIVPTGLSVRG